MFGIAHACFSCFVVVCVFLSVHMCGFDLLNAFCCLYTVNVVYLSFLSVAITGVLCIMNIISKYVAIDKSAVAKDMARGSS